MPDRYARCRDTIYAARYIDAALMSAMMALERDAAMLLMSARCYATAP